MRWFVALLLLFTSLGASAEARMKISADRAVVVVVNLVPHPLTGGSHEEIVIDIPNGKEGLQNVRVLNAIGQEQWKGQILVNEGQVVKARWKGRIFEVYGREQMGMRYGSKKPAPRPVAGHKSLDALAASTGTTGEDHVLAAIAAAGAQQAASEDGVHDDSQAPDEPSHGPVVAGEPGKLELVSRTSSWSNVWIDGALAHEFRGKETSIVLDLPTGEHEVQFRDFQDKEDWGHGTVTVHGDLVVALHFSKAEPPEALNRKTAWALAR